VIIFVKCGLTARYGIPLKLKIVRRLGYSLFIVYFPNQISWNANEQNGLDFVSFMASVNYTE